MIAPQICPPAASAVCLLLRSISDPFVARICPQNSHPNRSIFTRALPHRRYHARKISTGDLPVPRRHVYVRFRVPMQVRRRRHLPRFSGGGQLVGAPCSCYPTLQLARDSRESAGFRDDSTSSGGDPTFSWDLRAVYFESGVHVDALDASRGDAAEIHLGPNILGSRNCTRKPSSDASFSRSLDVHSTPLHVTAQICMFAHADDPTKRKWCARRRAALSRVSGEGSQHGA